MPAILLPRGPAVGSPAYNAQSLVAPTLTVTGVLCAFAATTVILRVYVRRVMLKCMGADDIVMVVAMLFGLVLYGCFIGESFQGLGRHYTILTPAQVQAFDHWQFYHSSVIIIGSTLAKISICLLLIRLVKHRAYAYFLWGLLGETTLILRLHDQC